MGSAMRWGSSALRVVVGAALALATVCVVGTTTPVPAAAEVPTPVPINPLTPARLLDTREGVGAPLGPVGPDGTIELAVAGEGGVPADGAAAVVLSVTVTEPTAPSFITVWPTGEPMPEASSLNMFPNETVPNLVIAKLGADGKVSLFNKFGDTHLIADVMAWIPAGLAYGPLTPERLLDTREGLGAAEGPVGPGGTVALDVVGRGGVPDSGAGSVVLNVTVTEPTDPSFVTVWPSGTDQPGTSSLNMFPGQTRPNLVISKIGPDGKVLLSNAFGTTHLIADVIGWIPDGAGFTGVTPVRVLDTRPAEGGAGPLGPDTTHTLALADQLPDDATAVALNLTITEPTAPTFITASPTGVERPNTSNLNAFPGDTRPVAVVVKLGNDQSIDLYNAFGDSHLIADLVGWYATPTANPISLLVNEALTPTQSLDDGRPVGVVAGGGVQTDLVANELVIVAPADVAQQVASDWHGTIRTTIESLDDLDPVHAIAFDLAAIDDADLPPLDEALAVLGNVDGSIGGTFEVNHASVAKLLRLQAALLADGVTAAINPLTEADWYADGNIVESAFDVNGDNSLRDDPVNAFQYPYLREGGPMDHGFASAWQQMDSYGLLRKAVKIAVFDGGFLDHDDLAPYTLLGASFGETNLASCGGSPCPWHGTAVAETIFATHNNGIGTAGGATPVVSELVAIGVGRDIVDAIRGLAWAPVRAAGAKAINISAAARVPVIAYAPLSIVLHPIAAGIRALGLQMVAAAGNAGSDVDDEDCFIGCWESAGWIPCELSGVLCVGGMKLDTNTHDTGSNYGSEDVDIWASYTVHVYKTPGWNDNGPRDHRINGTSFSAPLVTAAIALVTAANPSWSGPKAADVLRQYAHAGTGRARKVLDVQQAVNAAINARGPFVVATYPNDGTSLAYGQQVTLTATSCCATPTYEWREGPRGGTLTQIGSGRTPTVTLNRPPGPRTLEVRATFPGGVLKTSRVDYTITNKAPVVAIQRPFAGEEFFASDVVPLRGSATDEAFVLPGSALTWRIDGTVVATGPQFNATNVPVGTHTVSLSASDGNLTGTASRTFTVLEDPPDPPPVVEITSPIGADTGFPCPAWNDGNCEFEAIAISSDLGPGDTAMPAPTITWSYQLEGTPTETPIGTTDSGEAITVSFPQNPCATPQPIYYVFARVSDGTSTRTDQIRLLPISTIC